MCEKEELSGIFVKSVSAGSAAGESGRVRVNDRIVAVDGNSLAGKSNQRAVDALKQSGNVVTLELERYDFIIMLHHKLSIFTNILYF